MRSVLVSLVVLAGALASPRAAADPGDECVEAAELGQNLRDAHKLIQARDAFRRCAAPVCPQAVQVDCAGWATEVDKDVPTVVLSAKNAAGNDVFDVSVTMDGAPLVPKIEGVALAIDPGAHTFRFSWPDGTSQERRVLVAEGQKDVVVAAALGPASTSTASAEPRDGGAALSAKAGASRWRTAGWVIGAIGVVGLGVGGALTALTLSDKSAGDCNAAGACSHYGSIDSARSIAPAAGAGLIGGATLVATGAGILLFAHAPKDARPANAKTTLRARPVLGAGGAALLLEGAW